MKLEHEFTVPAPIDEAWKVLQDVERIAPCMPGATLLTIEGDSFTGTVKVKVGPIQVTYKGHAAFKDRDDAAHRLVIDASGKEARGTGTAAATVTTALVADGDSTRVWVETDLNVTGRPAQFGRGVMEEVAAKLIGQFASCLAEELAGGGAPVAEPGPSSAEAGSVASLPPLTNGSSRPDSATGSATAAAPVEEPPTTARVISQAREAQPIDLLDVAGGSIAKRLVPVAAVLVVLLLLVWRRRHRE